MKPRHRLRCVFAVPGEIVAEVPLPSILKPKADSPISADVPPFSDSYSVYRLQHVFEGDGPDPGWLAEFIVLPGVLYFRHRLHDGLD